MTIATLVVVVAVALAIGAVGFVVGMLLAPRIGRWAERMMDDDDDR